MESYIKLGDSLQLIKALPNKSVDLIITDPPYQIDNTTPGGHSKLAKSLVNMNDEIFNNNLTKGFNTEILDECVRVLKKLNIYIWCNGKQIPFYFNYFVDKLGASFDIIIWHKNNAAPLFNNKYLTDKEYCLYFRKNAYCNPSNYEEAKTVYELPINAADKKKYGHPTIKPLTIIKNLVKNSSKEGDIVLDPFLGSGTTVVACEMLKRKYIGFEINKDYFNIAKRRINEVQEQEEFFEQLKLF